MTKKKITSNVFLETLGSYRASYYTKSGKYIIEVYPNTEQRKLKTPYYDEEASLIVAETLTILEKKLDEYIEKVFWKVSERLDDTLNIVTYLTINPSSVNDEVYTLNPLTLVYESRWTSGYDRLPEKLKNLELVEIKTPYNYDLLLNPDSIDLENFLDNIAFNQGKEEITSADISDFLEAYVEDVSDSAEAALYKEEKSTFEKWAKSYDILNFANPTMIKRYGKAFVERIADILEWNNVLAIAGDEIEEAFREYLEGP